MDEFTVCRIGEYVFSTPDGHVGDLRENTFNSLV
jgi:hypothetical protein